MSRSAPLVWLLIGVGIIVTRAVGSPAVFRGDDLFRLECAADPQIAPDGSAVAYVRRTYDVMTDRARLSIWKVDTATGLQSPTAVGPGSYSLPRWSPDGKRLAYVAHTADGGNHLVVRWLQNGVEARISDLSETPSQLAWSPDGTAIAFELFTPRELAKLGAPPHRPDGARWAEPLQLYTSVDFRHDDDGYARPGEPHLYVVASDGGSPRQLTFGPFNESGPIAWTSDGRQILFSGQRFDAWQLDPQNSDLYAVAVSDGTLTQLTHRAGPMHAPEVSYDGSKIAYLGFDDHLRSYENTQLYVADTDGRNSHSVTNSLDRSVEEAHWAADSRSLYISYVERGVGKIARVWLDGHIDPIATGLSGATLDRPYSGGTFTVARNGVVAYSNGTPSRPADISIVSKGRERRLTWLNSDLFHERDLGSVRQISVMSTFDKRPLDAWLLTPPDAKPGRKYPLILEIHGGPFGSYGPTFSTDDQLYAAAGYAVAYGNPRGSTSYGAEFANLIHHDFPSHDFDDLMSIVDAVIATGSVDPDELFVTGGSGGGILTAWIVGKTHRFRAAASQKPVVNWSSQTLATDLSTYDTKYWFAKRPWEDPDTYWRHSPISLMGSVTTPTLVIVGDQDFRTTEDEAIQYFTALQLMRVPSALIRIPGASHAGLAGRPSQSAARVSAIISWFDRYRGDRVTSQSIK